MQNSFEAPDNPSTFTQERSALPTLLLVSLPSWTVASTLFPHRGQIGGLSLVMLDEDLTCSLDRTSRLLSWRNIKPANSKHLRKLLGSSTTTAESLDSGIMTISSPCYHIETAGSIPFTKFSVSLFLHLFCVSYFLLGFYS